MNLTHEQREASHILDLWKAGADEREGLSVGLVDWALRVTGDSLGLKHFNEDGEQILTLERRNA